MAWQGHELSGKRRRGTSPHTSLVRPRTDFVQEYGIFDTFSEPSAYHSPTLFASKRRTTSRELPEARIVSQGHSLKRNRRAESATVPSRPGPPPRLVCGMRQYFGSVNRLSPGPQAEANTMITCSAV